MSDLISLFLPSLHKLWGTGTDNPDAGGELRFRKEPTPLCSPNQL